MSRGRKELRTNMDYARRHKQVILERFLCFLVVQVVECLLQAQRRHGANIIN